MEGIILEGNIEMDLELSGGAEPLLIESLGWESANLAVHLFDLSRSMAYPVDSSIRSPIPSKREEI